MINIYLAGFSENKAISAGKDLKRPSSCGDTQPSKRLKEELVSCKPDGNDIMTLYMYLHLIAITLS